MAYHSNQHLQHHSSSKDLKQFGSCIISSHIPYPYKEYSILSSSKTMTDLANKPIKLPNDPIVKLKTFFDEIYHIPNTTSIIEYYHDTNQIGSQIVIEWINTFCTQYTEYIIKGYFIGLEELFSSSSSNETNESLSLNGINYYSSPTRNFIIKILCNLVKTCLCNNEDQEDANSIKTLAILSLCRLDYENASLYIKELLKLKDKEANIKCLQMMYQFVEYQSLKSLNEINTDIPKEYTIIYWLLKQEYNKILNTDSFSLLFKLIILFKYYSSQDIEQYLKAIRNSYIKNARIEVLIISGNSKQSITLLENYINNTDDIFLAYFITKFLNSNNNAQAQSQPVQLYINIEANYIETLNKLKLFTERLMVNQIINTLIEKVDFVRKSNNETEYFCYFCEGKIVIDKNSHRNGNANLNGDDYVDICNKCLGRFYLCSVCRIPIDIEASNKTKYRSMVDIQDSEDRLNSGNNESKFLWCSSCLHGGHLDEIRKWFSELNACPQADCLCLCLNYNHIFL